MRIDVPGMGNNEDRAWTQAAGGDPADLLTVYEVAAHLGIPKIAVYRLVETGQLDAVRHGNAVRIRRHSMRTLGLEAN